jgi:hypothetical protein
VSWAGVPHDAAFPVETPEPIKTESQQQIEPIETEFQERLEPIKMGLAGAVSA